MKLVNKIYKSKLRILLIPLTVLYVIVIYIKNWLYDAGILKVHNFNTFIISVGNLSTGGTGKTPFIIGLADKLISLGMKVCIISRGYKRKTEEQILVFNGEEIITDVSVTGDEPLMIASRLLNDSLNTFYVIADSDKIRAIKEAQSEFRPDIILLDDAYQQRKIKKNIDIAIIDSAAYSSGRFFENICLPAGNLREPYNNLNRADIVISNHKNNATNDISHLLSNYYVINGNYKLCGFFDYQGNIANNVFEKAVSFCGIADDSSFRNAINSYGVDIIKHFEFPDHYSYTTSDIESMMKLHSRDIMFITTEKDFIKIKDFKNFIENYPVYFLKIKFVTDWDKILKEIKN